MAETADIMLQQPFVLYKERLCICLCLQKPICQPSDYSLTSAFSDFMPCKSMELTGSELHERASLSSFQFKNLCIQSAIH